MSCYVLGDKMRGKDRVEERRGREEQERSENKHTYTALHLFPEHFQTVTKVSAVRKVKISILVATSHSSGEVESRKMKG